jgi:alkylation response protein AidB-like acyl-CoA dehydrogenase
MTAEEAIKLVKNGYVPCNHKRCRSMRGYGYMKGQKVERLMRDRKITEIYEGSSEAKWMVISGNVLR